MPIKSSLVSIINTKCPRCRKGDMFKYPLIRYNKFSAMFDRCPVCGLRYEVEPGFFIGAMYISYVMSLVMFFMVSLLLYIIFDDPEFIVYMIGILGAVVLLIPFMFRYSRALFLHWFGGVKYDQKYK